MSTEEFWEEVQRDYNSRSISQALSNNGYIYVSYRELLETDRLATYPNVSAITKGDQEKIALLIGEKPKHAIRHIIEPHHYPIDLSKGLDLSNFEIPNNKRRSEEHTSELQSLRHLV